MDGLIALDNRSLQKPEAPSQAYCELLFLSARYVDSVKAVASEFRLRRAHDSYRPLAAALSFANVCPFLWIRRDLLDTAALPRYAPRYPRPFETRLRSFRLRRQARYP
jgi:hypothetical protein